MYYLIVVFEGDGLLAPHGHAHYTSVCMHVDESVEPLYLYIAGTIESSFVYHNFLNSFHLLYTPLTSNAAATHELVGVAYAVYR